MGGGGGGVGVRGAGAGGRGARRDAFAPVAFAPVAFSAGRVVRKRRCIVYGIVRLPTRARVNTERRSPPRNFHVRASRGTHEGCEARRHTVCLPGAFCVFLMWINPRRGKNFLAAD